VSEPDHKTMELLAWGLCNALGDLMMELVEKGVIKERPASWNAALRAHDAFLGLAIAVDSDVSDEEVAAAVAEWVRR
jgi:hypothetical protein